MTMMTRLKKKRDSCSAATLSSSSTTVVIQRKGGIKRDRADDQYWGLQLLELLHHSLAAALPHPPPMILWREGRDYWFLWREGRDYWFLGMKEESGGGYYLYLPNNQTIPGKVRTCVGSSLGYLLLYHVGYEVNPRLSLFDTLHFTNFSLPHIMPTTKAHGHGLRKAVLWSHPTSGGGVVALHHVCNQLVFAKFGGATQFTELEGQDHEQDYPCNEMICINSRIYAINYLVHSHRLEAWDCSDADQPPRKILGFQPTFSYSKGLTMRTTLHLVESLGELLVVAIWRPDVTSKVDNRVNPICMVFKMDFKEKEWVRLDSLGDRVLCIMEFQNFSLSAKDFPQYQRNSVYFRLYFADRKRKTCVGIFNMEDGSLKQIGIDIMQA